MSLRERLRQPQPLLCPGVYDPLSAALAEAAGFEGVYLSGASVAYTLLGGPDIGLVTATQMADVIARLRDRISIPIIVDADSGFGNTLNTRHCVRMFERAGADVVQLEDLVFPKPSDQLRGRTLVPVPEMVSKVRAACDARDKALIMARTYATSIEGVAAALDRAAAYREAGADILFIDTPASPEGQAALSERFAGHVPLLLNLPEGPGAPELAMDELSRRGYRILICPSGLVRAIAQTAQTFLASLKATGSTAAFRDRMLDSKAFAELLQAEAVLRSAEEYV